MAAVARAHGFSAITVGGIKSHAQMKAFLITVKNDSNTAIDLRADDGTEGGNLNKLINALNPLMYTATNSNAGTVSVIMDGHGNTAASLQERVRRLFEATSGANDSTVADGATITVA